MAGQSAMESRKTVTTRMNDLDCSKQKHTGSGDSPHGNDHYDQGKSGTKHKGMEGMKGKK
jgi:hypothetical protein